MHFKISKNAQKFFSDIMNPDGSYDRDGSSAIG